MRKFSLFIMTVVFGSVLCGCSHKTFESVTTRIDTVRISDTVIVHTRPDTVKVEIPVSSQEVTTKDTTSYLHDKLYESEARWDGKFLHHSLRSLPGAALTTVVLVHDTVRVKEKAEKHVETVYKTKTVYVKPTWKDKFSLGGLGFLSCALIWLIYGFRKKIKRAWELIGL